MVPVRTRPQLMRGVRRRAYSHSKGRSTIPEAHPMSEIEGIAKLRIHSGKLEEFKALQMQVHSHHTVDAVRRHGLS